MDSILYVSTVFTDNTEWWRKEEQLFFRRFSKKHQAETLS